MSTDPATLLLFHKLVHRDERVTIEPWREEPSACAGARRCRSVVYKLPMRGPAWFRRLCGALPRAGCMVTASKHWPQTFCSSLSPAPRKYIDRLGSQDLFCIKQAPQCDLR